MTIQVEIRDGQPYWYLSPDIWVVPGTDPNGPPGAPVAGKPAYVWAHVTNNGTSQADQVRIDFWWADPSGQVLRSTANRIGSAFVDLSPANQPGSSADVLCLTAWPVTVVNGGHECLIAEALYTGSSVPSPPPDPFNPPTYPEVAQKNLNVVTALTGKPMLMLTLAAGPRADKRATVAAEVGGRLDEKALARLGLEGRRAGDGKGVEVGLARAAGCVPADGELGPRKLALDIPRGTRAAVHVGIRARELAPDEYVLVNVVEYDGDRPVGGYGYVVIGPEKEPVQ
jgi:hypothetical protein